MDNPPAIWSWPSALVTVFAAIIGALLGFLLKLKKLPSDVRKTEADTDLTSAQADDLRLKTRLSAMEMFSEMAGDIGDLQFDKLQLKKEVMRLTERERILEEQVERARRLGFLERARERGIGPNPAAALKPK